MSISMFPSYVASTGMTFRKPCGSSQSDVCGNLVIVPSLPTWFSLAVVERECTLVDTVVFLPKKPNYLGTHKHYSVIKVLRIYSRTGVKKWKEFLCLRAAALSSLPLNGEGLPTPIDNQTQRLFKNFPDQPQAVASQEQCQIYIAWIMPKRPSAPW